jgi:hypothetical protein
MEVVYLSNVEKLEGSIFNRAGVIELVLSLPLCEFFLNFYD